ncbi:MAG: hemerythrin domain-containing protein [Rhizobium sp.]|nr:hemerythrin domain-containing protein [Rhizobium sp.]
MKTADDSLGLLVRAGLPDDLRVLYARYPRGDWNTVHTIGQLGAFWLERHAMFRDFGRLLGSGLEDLREGRVTADRFAKWFAPRLNHFLGDLEGHHQVEDYQYFPLFAAADVRLASGFALLEEDHHQIHALLERNAETANRFYHDLTTGDERLPFSRDAYAVEADALLKGLERHLEDEEDLLIPLLLDQGERKFGGY